MIGAAGATVSRRSPDRSGVSFSNMPKLEIQSGKAAGRVVDLGLASSTITLGNRRNASVEIKDPWVSFNHAQITSQGDQYFITDARSKSGTFVNAQRVAQTPVRLAPGDKILLGKTEIRFVAEAGAAAPKPNAPETTAAAAAAPASTEAPTATLEVINRLKEQVASHERELGQAQNDLRVLREQHVTREKALAETMAKLRLAEAATTKAPAASPAELNAAREETARWKKQNEELTARARIKIEELTRFARTIEARADAGSDAATVIDKEREISKLREELRRVTEEARARLAEAASKATNAGNAAQAEELQSAEQRAVEAEREAGDLRNKVEDLETQVRELKLKLDEPSAADRELKLARAGARGAKQRRPAPRGFARVPRHRRQGCRQEDAGASGRGRRSRLGRHRTTQERARSSREACRGSPEAGRRASGSARGDQSGHARAGGGAPW